MKQVAIEIDEDTVEALAMRIDDSMPKLEDVERYVLVEACERRLEKNWISSTMPMQRARRRRGKS
jgi:hypothetical protein